MDVMSKHVEDKVIQSSQRGFTRGSDGFLRSNDWLGRWGRAVGAVYLDFSKAFHTVSCAILIGKLRKYGMG